MKPTVTIGIPSYNEAQNIGQLLESLLKQVSNSYILEKIIVCSDGSTDDTEQVVKKLESKRNNEKLTSS